MKIYSSASSISSTFTKTSCASFTIDQLLAFEEVHRQSEQQAQIPIDSPSLKSQDIQYYKENQEEYNYNTSMSIFKLNLYTFYKYVRKRLL